MQLLLTPAEKEQCFFNALCNIGGTFRGYGIVLDYDDVEYQLSKAKLTNPCFEDVCMQMLRDGYELKFIDEECEGEYTRSLTLQMIYDNIDTTPVQQLLNMMTENDDGDTADVILQCILYREVIFG